MPIYLVFSVTKSIACKNKEERKKINNYMILLIGPVHPKHKIATLIFIADRLISRHYDWFVSFAQLKETKVTWKRFYFMVTSVARMLPSLLPGKIVN